MRYFIFGLSLLGLFSCVGCNDKPTEPTHTKREYYFYGSEFLSHHLLRFAPTTGKVDTLYESDSAAIGRVAVSQDGKYLFRSHAGGVDICRAFPFEILRTLPYRGLVTCSPNGHYIAILGVISGNRPRGIRILRLPQFDEVYADDISLPFVQAGSFSWDGKELFFIDAQTGNVDRLDICSGQITVRAIAQMPGALTRMIPSVDRNLWFLYSRWDSFGYSYGVYDVAADSLIYLTELVPGAGSIVVSPDGKNVFFTNPGSLLIGPPPPSAFYLYDIPTNTVREISTLGWSQISGVESLPVGPMAITPDGRTLALVLANTGAEVLTFDVPTQTITNCFFYNWSPMFFDIHSQVSN